MMITHDNTIMWLGNFDCNSLAQHAIWSSSEGTSLADASRQRMLDSNGSSIKNQQRNTVRVTIQEFKTLNMKNST